MTLRRSLQRKIVTSYGTIRRHSVSYSDSSGRVIVGKFDKQFLGMFISTLLNAIFLVVRGIKSISSDGTLGLRPFDNPMMEGDSQYGCSELEAPFFFQVSDYFVKVSPNS